MAERVPDITVPKVIEANADAVETMRCWWTGAGNHMVFRPIFEDPRAFGFMLAEAAKHLSAVYAAKDSISPEDALAKIHEGWRDGNEAPMVTRMERDD